MAIRNIVKVGDPVLKKVSRKVEKFDKRLWTLLDDMKETLKKAEGAGLAAVQVGVLRRVVLVDIDDGKGLQELINPEIVEQSEETEEAEEGCLSLPNQWGLVRRPVRVVVKAQNRDGGWEFHVGEGLRARCYCHEIDHLNGHIFTDFVTKMLTEEEVKRLSEERTRIKNTEESNLK